jgi:tetratricopeptide (TPR) repeat protein
MQSRYLKILVVVGLILSTSVQAAWGQYLKKQLFLADSLFKIQKYPEALGIYNDVLNKSDQFSPQMLMKMAYIKDGMGDYTGALYHLNLLYYYNPDQQVLLQMEEIASRYNLQGYSFTDLEYFMFLYNEYYQYLIWAFIAFSGMAFVYLVIKKYRKLPLGFRPMVFIVLLALAFLFTNFEMIPQKGIIKNRTYLMSGASPGADRFNTVDEGHRVTILGKQDVWYLILWEGKTTYIQENNLLVIGEQSKKSIFSYFF